MLIDTSAVGFGNVVNPHFGAISINRGNLNGYGFAELTQLNMVRNVRVYVVAIQGEKADGHHLAWKNQNCESRFFLALQRVKLNRFPRPQCYGGLRQFLANPHPN